MKIFLFQFFFERDETIVTAKEIFIIGYALRDLPLSRLPARLNTFDPNLTIGFRFRSELDRITTITRIRDGEAVLGRD